jgi:hypothetical protein
VTASPSPAVITPLIATDRMVPSSIRLAGNVLGDALNAEREEVYSREWKVREPLTICFLCDMLCTQVASPTGVRVAFVVL